MADAAAGGAVLPPLVPDTSRVILPFAASSRVPPQASANGLEAGKSTCSLPSSWDWSRMSEEPSSPAATQTVTPKVAASWNRESMARMAWSVHATSGPPQLIDTTEGLHRRSWIALAIAL